MYKLVALFRKPADPQAFDHAYFGTHLPLIHKVPGLERIEVTRITGSLFGESDLYLLAELYFADKETLDRALASPENKAAGKNLMSFARDFTTLLLGQTEAS